MHETALPREVEALVRTPVRLIGREKRPGSALSVSSAFSYLICNNLAASFRWLGFTGQVEASRAEGMVFLAGLAGPTVDAVEGKPDGVAAERC